MGSNGVEHPLMGSKKEGLSSNQEFQKRFEQISSVDGSVRVEYITSSRQLEASPLVKTEESGRNSGNTKTDLFDEKQKVQTSSGNTTTSSETSQSNELNVSSSPRLGGLEHCTTAPVHSDRHPLIDGHDNISFFRSMTERRPWYELKFDRLSDQEKKKLIIELVKIQNDGTVEVDFDNSAPVASELLELRSVDETSFHVGDSFEPSNKPIPKLKIAILVVGTRGDVQPFLAIAKRLQEFGHHVRLATHTNFRNFVKSAGVEFYPLGGDPRVLAGYMARNKGFIPSGPGEITIQRKQLKAIIESLLPACTEPDVETGVPFRAQAIIANPPAYAL